MQENLENSYTEAIICMMMRCFLPEGASDELQNAIIEKIQMLKDEEIDITDRAGRSILHYAAAYGLDRIVEYLISKRADVNLQDKQALSPLGIALQNHHSQTAMILLKHGANPNLHDKWGNNALMNTRFLYPDPVFRVLLDAGCDPNEKNNYGINAFKIYEAYPEVLRILHGTNNTSENS